VLKKTWFFSRTYKHFRRDHKRPSRGNGAVARRLEVKKKAARGKGEGPRAARFWMTRVLRPKAPYRVITSFVKQVERTLAHPCEPSPRSHANPCLSNRFGQDPHHRDAVRWLRSTER
jgi:hypothetical protein